MKKIGIGLAAIVVLIAIVFVATSGVKTSVNVKKSIHINASRNEVWKVTALDFGGNSKWDAGVNKSEAFGKGENGAVCSERTCHVAVEGFDHITEKFTEYDAENYWFSYQGFSDDMPSMLKEGTNTWSHEIENDGTKMTMHTQMKLTGLMGILLQSKMKEIVTIRLEEALEELKYYVENEGEPHPRKAAAMALYNQE